VVLKRRWEGKGKGKAKIFDIIDTSPTSTLLYTGWDWKKIRLSRETS
tara:strand:+ start:192 stop:332 length:141 start_codon:yes stop_codon:yes gene_type:complete